MNVITAVIKGRHSIRKFKPTPVEDAAIHDSIECAVHAPTAMNLQPWLIGTIRDKSLIVKIARMTDHAQFIADASVCFAIFGERTAKYYLEDCCAATENLILGLHAHGVGSCWVAGERKTTQRMSENFSMCRKSIPLYHWFLPDYLQIFPLPKKKKPKRFSLLIHTKRTKFF